jgi:hypothetical protein
VDSYAVVAGLALLLGGAPLHAAPSSTPPLTVSLTGCPSAPISASAFVSAIALELGLRERPRFSRSSALAEISVQVDCAAKASIRIHIDGQSEQRDVRIDDVPVADRARVLALVVAELVRSSAANTTAAPEKNEEGASAIPAEPRGPTNAERPTGSSKPPPKRGAPAASEGARRLGRRSSDTRATDPEHAQSDARADPRPARAVRPWISAWTHVFSGAANALYGGGAGLRWHRSSLQVELGFASAERTTGSITAGVATTRYRHSLHLLGSGTVGLEAAASAAAGATWAVGESQTPGVVVRRALSPYADARLELALEFRLAGSITPELGVYSGAAHGLLATQNGEEVLSSGGWLLGTSIGSTF